MILVFTKTETLETFKWIFALIFTGSLEIRVVIFDGRRLTYLLKVIFNIFSMNVKTMNSDLPVYTPQEIFNWHTLQHWTIPTDLFISHL